MKKYLKNDGAWGSGFTLIELLIVIAILGVLAVVVLIAINPAEQLARTRDAGRISTVTQLGHAVQAYYTGNNAVYPVADATWDNVLTASGELSVFPATITQTVPCAESTTPAVNNLCYDLTVANGAIVYAHLESQQQKNKCTGTGADAAYALFATAAARGGVVCDADGNLDPQVATGWTFVQ